MEILTSGQYLRLPVAIAARKLRRGLPYLEEDPSVGGVVGDVRSVIRFATAFASGAPLDHTGAVRGLNPISGRLDPEKFGAAPGSALLVKSARQLANALVEHARGHLARHFADVTEKVLFEKARVAVRDSLGSARDGLYDATGKSEWELVRAAEDGDEEAFDHYVRREDDRLGTQGAWLADPTGTDVLGPPLEPSEGGPLGLLWPKGAPRWYHDEVEKPEIVSASAYLADPDRYVSASDVAFYKNFLAADLFEKAAEGFIEQVKVITVSRSRSIPPQRHVCLTDSLPEASLSDLFRKLTALGATVWHYTDLDPQPRSEDTFVMALDAFFRKARGRGQLLGPGPPKCPP